MSFETRFPALGIDRRPAGPALTASLVRLLLIGLGLIVMPLASAFAVPDEPPQPVASDTAAAAVAAEAATAEGAALPLVLVLGDSISIGYTPILTEQLAGVARVVRPVTDAGTPANCSGTSNGVAKVADWVTRYGKPDVITFNFGLHDLKREGKNEAGKVIASNSPNDPPQATPDAYRANLLKIVETLETTGAKLFFVTTTPVPPGGVRPHRDSGDPLLYNGVARQVVEPRGIEVIDLWSVAADKPEWMRPVNVHFTPEGSAGLAQALAGPIEIALKDLDAARRGQVVPSEAAGWEADAVLVERLSRDRPFRYREADVPSYELPDPLQGVDGAVADTQGWEPLRAETLQRFRDHVYGHVPAEAMEASVTYTPVAHYDGTNVIGKRIEARVTAGSSDFTFPILVYQPKLAADASPAPAIVMIHNRTFPDLVDLIERPSAFVPVEAIVKRGYAVAIFHTSHVDPDRKDGFREGIRGFFARVKHGDEADESVRQPNDWGSLAAWAWGAGRVLDYLETVPTIDAKRAAVIGHSRGGKTSAWTAASDPRFAAALVNESGCGGAAISRRQFGETIARITSSFPHWFCRQLNDYADAEERLPVDQHQLMGLIAPRAVAVASAAEDLWADPKGEYLSLYHAGPVFRLFGLESFEEPTVPPLGQPRFVGQTGYFVRPGGHGLHEGDWANYLDFLDERL